MEGLEGVRIAYKQKVRGSSPRAPTTQAFLRTADAGAGNRPDQEAGSIVTYTRTGDSQVNSFEGASRTLPDGEYTFRARATGFKDKIAKLHVMADMPPIDLTQAPEDKVEAS